MYKDHNLIRVLAACETMGNATNICSDKTGTLTENRMTVVELWSGDNVYTVRRLCLLSPPTPLDRSTDSVPTGYPRQTHNKQDMKGAGAALNSKLRDALSVNVAVNSAANVLFTGEDGKPLPRPKIVGSATEGALLLMIHGWGLKFTELKERHFDKATDVILPFNSAKKRATAIIRRGGDGGGVRVLVKGATEWVLADCTHYTTANGSPAPLTPAMRQRLETQVLTMADKALRTLCIAHRDFASAAALPPGWEEDPPDRASLVCDGIVGIIDPLRDDVKEAVRTAQRAGVMVRMITGDNIHTAKAIARVRFACLSPLSCRAVLRSSCTHTLIHTLTHPHTNAYTCNPTDRTAASSHRAGWPSRGPSSAPSRPRSSTPCSRASRCVARAFCMHIKTTPATTSDRPSPSFHIHP